jgi:hypothetical protein
MADNFVTTLASLPSGTQRVIAANAQSQGISADAYLASRGGVNPVTGKYGDSYDPARDLTDAEYKAAIAGKTGAERGAAINAATAAKNQAAGGATGPTGGAGGGGGATPSGLKSEAQIAAEAAAAERQGQRQSAYDLLYSQFKQYGLESLVEPLKGLVVSGVSPAEFTIKLRETEPYKKRFAGNAARIQKGLRALDEAEYIALEDQYQNVMRNYGLPASYYAKDAMGTQQGFTNLIAGNVSAAELESRVQQATDILDKGPKEYMDAIQQFYPGVQRGDLLAYVLDPEKALTKIQSTLGAAKIGGEYLRAGLGTDMARAEELQRQGVTAEAARKGAQAVLDIAPRGGVLSEIYQTGPYGQAQVEEEVYGLAGASEAKKRREKLTALETASFSGSSGAAQGALGRERAMGQGQF